MQGEEWPEPGRRRPGMYIGSVGPGGAASMVEDLVANVADQFLLGAASRVTVELHGSSARVVDDGPGLPFDQPSEVAPSLAEEYLSRHHTTPTADGHTPHVHLHRLGLGLAVVTALCERVEVTSWRHGRRFEQTFSRGRPLGPALESSSPGRGTAISLTLDEEIFGAVQFPVGPMRHRLWVAAHLFPGLILEVGEERFCHPDGISGLASADGSLEVPVRHRSVTDDLIIDFAALPARAWASSDRSQWPLWRSWANGASTTEGGDHVQAAEAVFAEMEWPASAALLHVILRDAVFAGPTRGRLVAPHLRSSVGAVVRAAIDAG